MAEITADGYQDLRDYIEANWDWISLRDDTDAEVLRLDPSDSRVTWTHASGDQTLVLEIVVQGSDSEISLPQTFAGSEIHKTSGSTTPFSDETYTQFTMESTNDQLTVEHEIEVPQV